MSGPTPLSYKQQVGLFQSRGMVINNVSNAEKLLAQLGYYRIKEAAKPLATFEGESVSYKNVAFDKVISRYYQDKNLRVYLLHCIEEVEVSVKTSVAYILGRNGPFNYLKFSSWCNREEYCRYYLSDRQKDFTKRLRSKISNSSNPEIKKSCNLNSKKQPSIWLAIDVLTFGDIIYLVELMSQNNLRRLADIYQCTPSELLSWLKCLKFVRNICAHNSNIIDIKLNTTPIIHDSWKHLLYKVEGPNEKYTDRIAIVLCVLRKIMDIVNPAYNYGKIFSSINTVASTDVLANQLGFRRRSSIASIMPKSGNKKRKNKLRMKRTT
ncbi:CAAX amino protease [Enterococcus florum]|uniref:CAAX amino protease n=1 Tax=Enterococcus florum TaxID=2480627 RepID=A0A4P5PTY0_9ENTE|nr:Abi family protein [Enterococcus florum]GCF95903.1 CAAX amino protease [Enterococcus florum]